MRLYGFKSILKQLVVDIYRGELGKGEQVLPSLCPTNSHKIPKWLSLFAAITLNRTSPFCHKTGLACDANRVNSHSVLHNKIKR